MYLRPDEVARVLETSGFERDYIDDKAYGYRRGEFYVYVNREARFGRTALVIHPAMKERSERFAEPTASFAAAMPTRISRWMCPATTKPTTAFATVSVHARFWRVIWITCSDKQSVKSDEKKPLTQRLFCI